MMWHEFEELAGYEVSFDDYSNIIEPMYLAVPETVTKADFVKMIDKKRFALRPLKAILKEMKKDAESLKKSCTHFTDWETKEHLESLIDEYMSRRGFKGIAGYMIESKTIYSCCYPVRIVIYGISNYKTFDDIKLF